MNMIWPSACEEAAVLPDSKTSASSTPRTGRQAMVLPCEKFAKTVSFVPLRLSGCLRSDVSCR